MKILLVCEDIPAKKLGGLGKHVVALGNALIADGHIVTLMGQGMPIYAECAEEVGFQGQFIVGFGNPLSGWKETQLGFFNTWKRPFFAKRLAKAINTVSGDYDVVHYHGHQPMVGRYIPSDVNFIQTRHDQGGDCITNMRFRDGAVCHERAPSACAQCIHPSPGVFRTLLSTNAVQRYRTETEAAFALHPVVFVSSFLRENYGRTRQNARLENSVVIHNFVNENLLAESLYAQKPMVNSRDVSIHIAGRLDEPKGIAALLDLLAPRLPIGWVVDIYGDGPLRHEIAAKHAGATIRLHGHRLYSEIVEATRKASVVIVPSVCQESCGTTILEALRLGKVCYALRRGGTPELTRYGVLGQLRLFDDLPALVDALLLARDINDCTGGDSADVQPRMHELIALYLRGIQRN